MVCDSVCVGDVCVFWDVVWCCFDWLACLRFVCCCFDGLGFHVVCDSLVLFCDCFVCVVSFGIFGCWSLLLICVFF